MSVHMSYTGADYVASWSDEQRHCSHSIQACGLTPIGDWNDGCAFKISCQLFFLLPHCRHHLAFRFFPVQPATSSIKQHAIRLTAVRNKNGSLMNASVYDNEPSVSLANIVLSVRSAKMQKSPEPSGAVPGTFSGCPALAMLAFRFYSDYVLASCGLARMMFYV